MKQTAPYSYLAPLYDKLMEDVDYEAWADYIDEIIQEHAPESTHLLELACGTGSVSLSLDELGYYRILATDLSPEMIEVAIKKGIEQNSSVKFKPMNFLNIRTERVYDVIFSVFDSVNYLHSERDILKMLEGCERALKHEGLLIFDFSTPRNSLEAVDYLNNEEGSTADFRYFRTSNYDPHLRIHTNSFNIERLSTDKKNIIGTYLEEHKQKIYTLDEMLLILKQTPYHLVAKYGDFDLDEADENSARITLVLKCQKQQ